MTSTLPVPQTASLTPPKPADSPFRLLCRSIDATSSASTSRDAVRALYNILRSEVGAILLELTIFRDGVSCVERVGEEPNSAENRQLLRTWESPLVTQGDISGKLAMTAPAGRNLPDEYLRAAAQLMLEKLLAEHRRSTAEMAAARSVGRVNEIAAIYEIGLAIDLEQIEPIRLYEIITERAAVVLEAESCVLMAFDDTSRTLRLAAAYGPRPEDLCDEAWFSKGALGSVTAANDPVLIASDSGANTGGNPHTNGCRRVASTMLVPMRLSDGRFLGVLAMRRPIGDPDFTTSDLRLLSVFASQAILATTNIRLYKDVGKRAYELGKLSTLSRALISTIDLDKLMDAMAGDISEVVELARCCIYVYDPVRRTFQPRVWRGYSEGVVRNLSRSSEAIILDAVRNRYLLYYDARKPDIVEAELDRTMNQRRGFARALGAECFITAPILNGKSECIGAVVADNRGNGGVITPEQRHLLSAFIGQAGIAMDNAMLYVRTQEDFHKIRRLTEYTENVLQSIPAGIVSTDCNGIILRCNRAAATMLHSGTKNTSKLFGRRILDVLTQLGASAEEQLRFAETMNRVVRSGESVFQHKLSISPGDETKPGIDFNINLSRLQYRTDPLGVVLSIDDVTREVSLTAQVERIRRLADIGQLAAKMAHEVRNALSPIRAAAQMIRAEAGEKPELTEWPEMIIAEVDGLNRLTSAMLDFARPTTLDVRVIQLSDFLKRCVNSLHQLLTENGTEITWTILPNLPELKADPVQLGQAFRNIIINAAQSMPDGGSLHIQCEVDPPARNFIIRFSDCGMGIGHADIQRIFRPFVTTKPKGTGLGLPIASKIISTHGGRIDVSSTIGEGACFSVWLPLEPPEQVCGLEATDVPLISTQHGRYPDN